MRLLFLHIILFFSVFFDRLSSQNLIIYGKALGSDRSKHEISLYSYSDLITKNRIKEAVDTIATDGSFSFNLTVNTIQAVELQIGNEIAKLYVQPYFQYSVIFPEKDSINNLNPDIDYKTDLIIYGDSAELNARIIDYNTQFDNFWLKKYKAFVTRKFHFELDSFKLIVNQRYSAVKNSYFKSYVEYSLATIFENTGRAHFILAKDYLLDRPVLYAHYEYMEFFNQFFKNYFQRQAATEMGNQILFSINESADLAMLSAQLKADPILKNDTLRELVILKNLFDLYYVTGFNKQNILTMTEQLLQKTTIKEHRLIAQNILRNFHKLEAGAQAPDFSMLDMNGKINSLADLKGKFVYVIFFSTSADKCLQELKALEKIYLKYKNDVVFVSISVDDSQQKLRLFLQRNNKYNWIFLRSDNSKEVREKYDVKTYPIGFLIGRNGSFLSSPSPLPSEGLEQKLNQLFKRK